MSKKYGNIIYIATGMAIFFGIFFAYNAYVFVRHWFDGRNSLASAQMAQQVFDGWISEADVPVVAKPSPLPSPFPLPSPPPQSAASGADTETETAVPEIPEEQEEQEQELLLLGEMREMTGNEDIVAYLHVPGTNISSVVLQGSDNSFYLDHDMFREPNMHGAFFLDYTNFPDFSGKNNIIYGHNMRNGTMFHNLRYFMDAPFFEENRYIKIFTDEETLTYEIFAAFSTHTSFNYIKTEFEPAEFEEFLDELTHMNFHETDFYLNADDRVLILSTCTGQGADMRFVVAGRLCAELT